MLEAEKESETENFRVLMPNAVVLVFLIKFLKGKCQGNAFLIHLLKDRKEWLKIGRTEIIWLNLLY